MKILKKSVGEAWTHSEQIAACIGYFDGLHIGHMGLVRNGRAAGCADRPDAGAHHL